MRSPSRYWNATLLALITVPALCSTSAGQPAPIRRDAKATSAVSGGAPLAPERNRQPTTDPKVARESLTAWLKASGIDRESKQTAIAMHAIKEAQTALLDAKATVRILEPTCYRAGCIAPVHVSGEFPRQQQTVADKVKARWPGELFITGPEPRTDGSMDCSLVVIFPTK